MTNQTSVNPGAYLGIGTHRGAIDSTTTTSQLPKEVMKNVKSALDGMGVEIQVQSEYRYRCIRAKRQQQSSVEPEVQADLDVVASASPSCNPNPEQVSVPSTLAFS